jgi:hypothetical protein
VGGFKKKRQWKTRGKAETHGDTIKQRDSRRETSWEASWETKETGFGKADALSNKGKQEGRQTGR